MTLDKKIITQVIGFCNRDLVPDEQFKSGATPYPIDWFSDYFSFLENPKLQKYLGEAYYQARFLYKLMNGLRLPIAKHRAIVRFQIIQYASICEAILQAAIETFYKSEFEEKYAVTQMIKCQNALSTSTKITFENKNVYLCKEKKIKADIKRERIDHKTEFAVDHNIISSATKISLDSLYDSRNNIHILKAAQNNYTPTLIEAKNAFALMRTFVSEVKTFYFSKNNN